MQLISTSLTAYFLQNNHTFDLPYGSKYKAAVEIRSVMAKKATHVDN